MVFIYFILLCSEKYYSNEADRDKRLCLTLQVISLKVATRITEGKTRMITATMRTMGVMMMVIMACHCFCGAFERLPGMCLPLRHYFHTIFLLVVSSQLCTACALLPLRLYRSVLLLGASTILCIAVVEIWFYFQ